MSGLLAALALSTFFHGEIGLKLLDVPQGSKSVTADAVSDDGITVAGSLENAGGKRSAIIWVNRKVSFISKPYFRPTFKAVSPSGNVAVGWTAGSAISGLQTAHVMWMFVQVFVWTQKTGIVEIPLDDSPVNVDRVFALAVDEKQNVTATFVGQGKSGPARRAELMTWSPGQKPVFSDLPEFPDIEQYQFEHLLYAQSPNGQFSVGWGVREKDWHPSLWDASGNRVVLQEAGNDPTPVGVSNDGQTVIENADWHEGWAPESHGFVWTKKSGLRSIESIIGPKQTGTLEAQDYSLLGGVSANGQFVSGTLAFKDPKMPPLAFVLRVRPSE